MSSISQRIRAPGAWSPDHVRAAPACSAPPCPSTRPSLCSFAAATVRTAGRQVRDDRPVRDVVQVLRRIERAAEGHRGPVPRGIVALRLPRRDVDLAAARGRNHLLELVRLDAAAGHDLDAVLRVVDQAPDEVEPLPHRVALAAGQHARDAEIDQLVERAERIGRHVERAMEHGLARADQIAQPLRPREVDAAVFGQDAEDDAVGAVRDGHLGVALHRGHLGLGVAESAAARPRHEDHRNRQPPLRLDQRAVGRRQAAQKQARAQLDAVGAARARFQRVIQRPATDFQPHPIHDSLVAADADDPFSRPFVGRSRRSRARTYLTFHSWMPAENFSGSCTSSRTAVVWTGAKRTVL